MKNVVLPFAACACSSPPAPALALASALSPSVAGAEADASPPRLLNPLNASAALALHPSSPPGALVGHIFDALLELGLGNGEAERAGLARGDKGEGD